MARFYSFPKTVHISGSAVVDDDKVSNASDILQSINHSNANKIIIQEKVDGTNVSVHFEQEWIPICQKRSGLILSNEQKQYNVFQTWCNERLELLFQMLNTRYVLFGEFLWAQHGVAYDELEDYFIAFDIYDKASGTFLSSDLIISLLDESICFEITVEKVNKQFLETLTTLIDKSAFSSESTAEGIYLRIENNLKVLDRYKLRRDSFVAGREDFKKTIVNNKLKS